MIKSIRRSDEELGQLLDDDAVWTIHGQRDQILGAAINLRRALTRAGKHGSDVVAISQILPGRIFIFRDQIGRLSLS
jgi:hypothetical protein